MKKYAVATMDYFHNMLEIKIVEAGDWKEALITAFPEYIHIEANNFEDAKQEAFDSDCMFEVKEIKD